MNRIDALEKLKEHVRDDYQIMHAKMVAIVLEEYAKKLGENEELWYLTGLLHDIDYFEFPDQHPLESVKWFKEWNLSEELIQAVLAHYHEMTKIEPSTKLAACLCATDELCGFLYAYSLMRETGFVGMEYSSVNKKLKDKAFARKINREDINYGIEKFGIDKKDHIEFVIHILQNFDKMK